MVFSPRRSVVRQGVGHMNPNSAQAKLLDNLSELVGAMPEVYEEAQRNRDMYQKNLTEMIEDTLKHIQRAQAQAAQKSRHVKDTTASYGAKFEHDISCVREEMRHLLNERSAKIEGRLDELESCDMDGYCQRPICMNRLIVNLEADLERQREFRKQHTEEILGPIRDEVHRLTAALETERRTRRKEEAKREKMVTLEVDAFTKEMEAERFARSRQLTDFTLLTEGRHADAQKMQYQAEKEVTERKRAFLEELKHAAQDRIRVQHNVIESIANFVKRYHEQLRLDVERSADHTVAVVAGAVS